MNFNNITSTFVLKTCDLPSGYANANNNGYKYTDNSVFSFSNVDFRKIMGPIMYNKYDYFNINLVYACASIPTGTFTTYYNDSNATIQLSGLDFMNSSVSKAYVTPDGATNLEMKKKTTCDIGFYNVSPVNTYVFANQTIYGAMINKPTVHNLDITLYSNEDGKDINTVSGAFPEWVFVFKINGIPKKVMDNNISQMPTIQKFKKK